MEKNYCTPVKIIFKKYGTKENALNLMRFK